MEGTLLRRASAWLPIGMSTAALAIILLHLVRFGAAAQADEGTSAHLFQFLMAAQIPVIAMFALTSLPERPAYALRIVALQFAAALVPLALLFRLGW